MEIDVEVVETLPCPQDVKVHRLMCTKLLKLVERILKILPEIEASRPRSLLGIQPLCSLNGGIEKAKLLLQHCCESSKLYLAITGDTILSRCKRATNLLEQSLSEIQNNVPVTLAAEISRIIFDLRGATFSLDSSEEEAGKVLRAFLQQYASSADSMPKSTIKTIQFAAFRLQITSQKDILVEKRSIKKLLHKVDDSNPAKRQTILCLMDLLKYGQLIVREQAEIVCLQRKESSAFVHSCASAEVEFHAGHEPDESTTDMLNGAIPPAELMCPVSLRLINDPVVIASGQTCERVWIQKWFDEGHDTCPNSNRKLVQLSLIPNPSTKHLISKWCAANRVIIPDSCIQSAELGSWGTSLLSIGSFNNSMNDLYLPLDFSNILLEALDSKVSDSSCDKITDNSNLVSVLTNYEPHRFQSCLKMLEKDEDFLNRIDELPWEFQCEVVEDVKNHLKHDDQVFHSMSFENFVEPLIKFLKSALDVHDLKAQRTGTPLLLAFMSMCSSSIPNLHEEAYSLIASLLDSEVTEEALAILEMMSCHQCCRPKIAASEAPHSILKMLETQTTKFQEPAIRILYNLSSTSDICSLIVPSDFIPKLVPFFEDTAFTGYCISILKNWCCCEDARVAIAETDGCISSITKLLEIGSHEVQEHAVTVLLSLCAQRVQYCRLVMDEGVIPSLVNISMNGNERGMASAMELLRLLKGIDYCDKQESSGTELDLSRNSGNHCKVKKSSSKAYRFFGLKIWIQNSISSFR